MKQERLLNVIVSPHISEKATIGMEKRGEYVFHVIDNSKKAEVKDAVELLFKTKVKAVRIVNVRAKQKMFKGMKGAHKAWKKAYVTLEAGQSLDMFGAQ